MTQENGSTPGGGELDPSLFPDGSQAAAQAIWDQGTKEAKSDSPEGTFQVSIDEATLGRSLSKGRLQIHWKMTILAGEFQGKVLNKYDGLETAQQAKITQQQLARLGIAADKVKLEQLPAVLLSLQGKKASIMGKMNGQFYNIYFQKLILEGAAGTVVAGQAPQGVNAPPKRAF